jgi:hypothetical protein
MNGASATAAGQPISTNSTAAKPITLHFIDGTESHGSYAVVARHGPIFLGVRFSGITRGEQLGAPGKAYLQIRVRSARHQALADKLDAEAGDNNVVNLVDKQLPLDAVWPGLTFEKLDSDRASVVVGMFIAGSVPAAGDKVVARITMRPCCCTNTAAQMTYSSHPDVFHSYFSSNKNLLEISMTKGKKSGSQRG